MKKLTLIILFLLPISIISFVVKYKTDFFSLNLNEKLPVEKNLIVNIIDKNIVISLEEYVIGVVAGEMPALFAEEALKAQAVAARSYVLSKNKHEQINISSTINDQIFLTKEEMQDKWNDKYEEYYTKIKNSVLATKNYVLKRDHKILKAYYFSMSNGYTLDSKDVFGETYLTGKDSKWDNEEITNYKYDTKISKKEIQNLLNLNSSDIIIKNINRKKTNHVDNLEVNNIILKGTEFRKLLSLRSTDFTIIEYEEYYKITTKGYGHGVGMSQYGANSMAKEGYNYQEILYHYYDNVKIEEI